MTSDTATLQTEQRNPRTTELDTLSTADMVRVLHAENHLVAAAIDAALPEIARAIDVIANRLRRGGRLFYVGAGTSGRIGVLDASECPPTFGVAAEMVCAIIAGGDIALQASMEGAEDDAGAGANDLQNHGVNDGDVVVGIAASGRTPYAIGALDAARKVGAFAIAVVNVSPSRLSDSSDLTIAAVTGPEALTGSTRLKAGTAQKMILNLLSTGAMIRLGKVFSNLMVDVRATNEKLRERAVRIVCEAAAVDSDRARQALEASEWQAKIAIVMLRLGLDADRATDRLRDSHDSVRAAIESI